jgi:hypothetical protein
MANGLNRFECLAEPSGTWMVYDNLRNMPASLGGRELCGRQKQRAEAACAILTRIFQNRATINALRERSTASDTGIESAIAFDQK